MLIPGMCRADDNRQEAFLDAQMLVDGWEASYCHIDSLKVSYIKILVDEKGQDPRNLQLTRFMHHETIQDGTQFLSRFTGAKQGFDNGPYLINSFDGSIGREYIYQDSHGNGSIYRGLRDRTTERMNLLADFLQTNPPLAARPVSEKDPPWKVKLRQQYPLGIPVFLDKYNVALESGEVKVRPHLEYVAGEICHVLELDRISRVETFWFAHEKGMLPMKTMFVSDPVPGKVTKKEVKEIVSVETETGILWYPHVIMEERTRGPDYSYTMKMTIDEFVPHFKAPPETFSYVFPIGTRVWDKIQNLNYIVGPVELEKEMSAYELDILESEPVDNKALPVTKEENKELEGTEDGYTVVTQGQSVKTNNKDNSQKTKNFVMLSLLVIIVTGFAVILIMRGMIFRKKTIKELN
jgi:hypothetical protein